jgi:hypothetical protein
MKIKVGRSVFATSIGKSENRFWKFLLSDPKGHFSVLIFLGSSSKRIGAISFDISKPDEESESGFPGHVAG